MYCFWLGDRVLNVFPGYKAQFVEKVNMDIIKTLLRHIHEVWSSKDRETSGWLIKWLHAVQKPTELVKVAPVLLGMLGGEGKGIILQWLIE